MASWRCSCNCWWTLFFWQSQIRIRQNYEKRSAYKYDKHTVERDWFCEDTHTRNAGFGRKRWAADHSLCTDENVLLFAHLITSTTVPVTSSTLHLIQCTEVSLLQLMPSFMFCDFSAGINAAVGKNSAPLHSFYPLNLRIMKQPATVKECFVHFQSQLFCTLVFKLI